MKTNNKSDFLLQRVEDIARHSDKQRCPLHTFFLNPAELLLINNAVLPSGISLTQWGGYDEAERRIVLLFPDFYSFDELQLNEITEITVLHCKNTADKCLTHKDYLGSLMSLGIERHTIGDILVNDDEALIFLQASITEFVLSDFERVSNTKIEIKLIDTLDMAMINRFKAKKEERTVIVSSLRLDAVVSEVYGISRNESQKLIQSDNVRVNYTTVNKADKQLVDNDLISVDKKGRFILSETKGFTKKDRIILSVLQYV